MVKAKHIDFTDNVLISHDTAGNCMTSLSVPSSNRLKERDRNSAQMSIRGSTIYLYPQHRKQ